LEGISGKNSRGKVSCSVVAQEVIREMIQVIVTAECWMEHRYVYKA